MNLENVRALADILCAKGLSAIEVGEGENRIRIEKETNATSVPSQSAASPIKAQAQPKQDEIAAPAIPGDANREDDNQTGGHMDLIEVKSPLVGVYYAAPSPDAETFVSIGSKVKKGDVLCIIEAMKLMNEITAEQDGEIIDICVKNGDIAEFGQVLFKMN